MKIKIEKSVPLPRKQSPKKGQSQFPFEDMNVGNSLFIPCDNKKYLSRQQSIMTSAKSFVRHNNKDWVFTTRRVDKGVRIWRIK